MLYILYRLSCRVDHTVGVDRKPTAAAYVAYMDGRITVTIQCNHAQLIVGDCRLTVSHLVAINTSNLYDVS